MAVMDKGERTFPSKGMPRKEGGHGNLIVRFQVHP
jgi:hypothetical protein